MYKEDFEVVKTLCDLYFHTNNEEFYNCIFRIISNVRNRKCLRMDITSNDLKIINSVYKTNIGVILVFLDFVGDSIRTKKVLNEYLVNDISNIVVSY